MLPFSREQFLDVFARYNESVWPAQLVLVALAIGAVLLERKGTGLARRSASGILAFLWLWMGVVYHLLFFRAINPAAVVFGILFVVQALLLLGLGVVRGPLPRDPSNRTTGIVMDLLIAYALLLYPLIGEALGRRYPELPTFGLPCPTTIFTLGMLLGTAHRASRSLFVIPLLWCAIGASAAFQFGMREDFGLVVVGLAVLPPLLQRRPPRRAATLARA